MVHHFLAHEGGHPTWEENFIEECKMQGLLSLNTHVNDLQNQLDVVSNTAEKFKKKNPVYFFIIIDQSGNTLLLNTTSEPQPTFSANHCPFRNSGSVQYQLF